MHLHHAPDMARKPGKKQPDIPLGQVEQPSGLPMTAKCDAQLERFIISTWLVIFLWMIGWIGGIKPDLVYPCLGYQHQWTFSYFVHAAIADALFAQQIFDMAPVLLQGSLHDLCF